MPLWDFRCDRCVQVYELWFSSYAASQHAVCPTCQSSVVRLPSIGGFVVNGYNAKNQYSKKS
ncbi:MAG: FmdB family zinc ribbon protein [Ilumatobacteraceae bacterium]